jgi:hypothetical protein
MKNQKCCEALESLISDPYDSPLHYIPYKRELVLTTPRRYLKGPHEVALKVRHHRLAGGLMNCEQPQGLPWLVGSIYND